jgi:hypothetical protein
MAEQTMKEIMATAREVYEKTMCATGCCGDFEHAMEYVDGAVGEMVQGIVNMLVDRDLTNQLFRVGLNGFGFAVMVCDICGETFAKNIAGKTLAELFEIRSAHKCVEPLQNGVKIT